MGNEFNAPAVVRVAPLNYIGDDKVYVYVTRSKAGKFLTSKMVKQYDIVVTMQHGADIEEIKTIKLKRTKTAYEKNPKCLRGSRLSTVGRRILPDDWRKGEIRTGQQ